MKTTTFKLFILCIVLGATACSSNDSNEKETPASEQKLYDYYVDSKMQTAIDQLGITIHKGNTPPNVEGIYTIDPLRCTMSNFNDGYLGLSIGTSTLTLSNQNTARLSVDFKNFTIYYDPKNEIWEGKGSFISGQDNKFSILLHSHGELDTGTDKAKYQNLIIFSGELDVQDNKIKGIKNLQLASIMSDDYKDPYDILISIGQGRLFTNKYAAVK
ncbi:hypothetical protein [Flavobacterium sp. ov086]|uniref:hypothetical protein n=1 Tax=Flavobacterium sp. ov086 TaxID=1761785 RepID=UPI000B724099|nr:hypothetical protein [Flavobacterium sp. ov086]SNR72042.1 hypothetical protein SAMN04487979_11837 [Flavobacterium sp. ov086]